MQHLTYLEVVGQHCNPHWRVEIRLAEAVEEHRLEGLEALLERPVAVVEHNTCTKPHNLHNRHKQHTGPHCRKLLSGLLLQVPQEYRAVPERLDSVLSRSLVYRRTQLRSHLRKTHSLGDRLAHNRPVRNLFVVADSP